MRAASIQELKPIRHLNPRVSRELESAILKAMSLKADERYVSMRDFREALAGHVRQQLFECPRCRVINDPNASACASCGARFKHLETFIMRNGEKIVGIENFAQVCDKHWDDAIYHFENGDFEAWLAAAGRGDLKAIMQQCRRKEASADFALEMFLHQAKLVKTKRKPFRLAQGVMIRRLADIGERCDENWEALKGAFHDREMERWLLSWNRQDLIDLQASIKANIEDPDIAFETFLEEAALVKRPRIKAELAECWDTVPADTPKKQAITIENLSRGWLFGKIRLLKRLPGLKLSSDTFSGNRACVHLHLDTSACKAQKTYQTKVRIESNGGIIDLPVRFRVERAWADFWRSIGLWALLFGLTTGLLRLGLYALGYNQYLGSTSVTFWHLRQLVSLPISAVVAGGIAGGAGLIALLNRIGRSLRWYLIIPLTVLSWVGISGAFIWGGINSYYGLVWALQRVGVGIEWGDQLWRLLTPWGLMGMSAGVCFGLLRQTKRYGQWWLLPSAIVLPVVVWLMLLHYGQGNYLTQLQGAIIHVLEGLKKTALSYKL